MTYRRFLVVLILVTFVTGCNQKEKKEDSSWRTKKLAIENQVHNTLLAVEEEQGWNLLFNGNDLEGWHLYNKPDSTSYSAWEVKDGAIYCNATDESRVFGDLITDHSFENYELVFEWQMALRGNGGVFINVQEAPEFAATYVTGPEYQLLEPAHSDTNTPKKRPGCLWGIAPQINTVEAKPTGQWNSAKIIQNNGKIAFYLNGKLTASADLNSPEWQKQLSESNFANNPNFGKATKGKIALQNWYFDAWFRNMKIRSL